MRRPDQHEHKTHGTPITAWLPVVAAMAIMITGCLSTFLVLQLDEFRPKVGDVVVFKPGSQDTDTWQMSIPATISPISKANPTNAGAASFSGGGFSCALDPNVMATDGGSLFVEARVDAPSLAYRVHWAGSRTSADSKNCGSAADLTVSRTDLQRLANSAGGFGIGDKGIASRK